MKIRLGVNIDHIATLRQARYADSLSDNIEPDPILLALEVEEGGADVITAHLREDRRHILDHDIFSLRKNISTALNLEMCNIEEMIRIAVAVHPDDVCLVPEKREEITTEGGLDCVREKNRLLPTLEILSLEKIKVSIFVDPVPEQINACIQLGVQHIELHTGKYANATHEMKNMELENLKFCAKIASEAGIKIHAGHGINYQNVQPLLHIPCLEVLNIGHAIVSRALFVGMKQATREMVNLIRNH